MPIHCCCMVFHTAPFVRRYGHSVYGRPTRLIGILIKTTNKRIARDKLRTYVADVNNQPKKAVDKPKTEQHRLSTNAELRHQQIFRFGIERRTQFVVHTQRRETESAEACGSHTYTQRGPVWCETSENGPTTMWPFGCVRVVFCVCILCCALHHSHSCTASQQPAEQCRRAQFTILHMCTGTIP